MRTIYEAYKDNITIQFENQEEAEQYAASNNMMVRQITVPEEPVNYAPNWLGLEQGLYNSQLFLKILNTINNNPDSKLVFGFSFLSKVLTDGKLSGASENALNLALSILLPLVSITQEEVNLINQLLELNNFNLRVNYENI